MNMLHTRLLHSALVLSRAVTGLQLAFLCLPRHTLGRCAMHALMCVSARGGVTPRTSRALESCPIHLGTRILTVSSPRVRGVMSDPSRILMSRPHVSVV